MFDLLRSFHVCIKKTAIKKKRFGKKDLEYLYKSFLIKMFFDKTMFSVCKRQ